MRLDATKKKGICCYINGGGNKTFHANGVLHGLREAGVSFSHLIGFSASSSIAIATILGRNKEIIDLYGDKLDANYSNIHWFKKNMFPQDMIYKESNKEMLDAYTCPEEYQNIHFSILAAQSSLTKKRIKGLVASGTLLLKDTLGIDLRTPVAKSLGVKASLFEGKGSDISSELLNVIMGTSTLYPFIKLYTFRNKLLLEGSLVAEEGVCILNQYDKKLMIHNHKGETGLVDDIFHIYASSILPNNILDYTSSKPIRLMHEQGVESFMKNKQEILSYLER